MKGLSKLTPHKKSLLLTALLENYPRAYITGYVLDAYISNYCVVGRVYKSRVYPDGTLILSESITQVFDYTRRYLIETCEHECFLVVSFHSHGGRQSLEHLLALFNSAAKAGSRYYLH